MEPGFVNLRVEFHPSEDLPGVWIGSCPEIDLATQGNSLEEARSNLRDALQDWFAYCLEYGTLEEALRECGLQPQRIASIKAAVPAFTHTRGTRECHA